MQDDARAAASEAAAMVTHGEGPGIAVLLHAAGSGPRALGRLAQRLLPVVGRTAAPVVGPGKAAPDEEPGFGSAVDRVVGLLEDDGAGRRLLLGHSMGGLVCLLALLRGAKADAAVLYEPIVLSLLDGNDEGDRAALRWDGEVIADFRAHLARGETQAGVARFIEAYGELPWQALPEPARAGLVRDALRLITAATATNAARLDTADVQRIEIPVLVVSGTRSPDVTQRMARRLAGLLPHSELVVIDGPGHMGPVTAPDAVAGVILRFLGQHGWNR